MCFDQIYTLLVLLHMSIDAACILDCECIYVGVTSIQPEGN